MSRLLLPVIKAKKEVVNQSSVAGFLFEMKRFAGRGGSRGIFKPLSDYHFIGMNSA